MTDIVETAYRRPDLPRDLELQVLAFGRIVWGVNDGDDRFRERMLDLPDTMHFVRQAGSVLVSHVQVRVEHADGAERPLRIGGVGGVMTYPAFRGEGHATALMERVAAYLADDGFDLGMLFCDPETEPFYERLGWRAFPVERIRVAGDPPSEGVMVLGDPRPLADVSYVAHQW